MVTGGHRFKDRKVFSFTADTSPGAWHRWVVATSKTTELRQGLWGQIRDDQKILLTQERSLGFTSWLYVLWCFMSLALFDHDPVLTVPWCSMLKYVGSSRYAVLYQLKHNSAPGMHLQGGPVSKYGRLVDPQCATAATGTAGRSAALAGRHMLWHGQRTQNFTNFTNSSSSQIKSVWSSKFWEFWAWLSASICINL